MITRLYAHNFRCFENFEVRFDHDSTLLLGKNGSGKSTLILALRALQRIAQGRAQLSSIISPEDAFFGRSDMSIRLELHATVLGVEFEYAISVMAPKAERDLQILEETLVGPHSIVLERSGERATFHQIGSGPFEGPIRADVPALTMLPGREHTPENQFRDWLSKLLILKPTPSLMNGESRGETFYPRPDGSDFGAWFSGIVSNYPSSYRKIEAYLRDVIPSLEEIRNLSLGRSVRSLEVHFSANGGSSTLPFAELSDGEKCFVLCSAVLAANAAYGPLVCVWDEPDNYLALSEVGHFIMALRKSMEKSGGQLIVTSHNPEAVRAFSREATLLLFRNSHFEPTQVRKVSELTFGGSVSEAMLRGDLEP